MDQMALLHLTSSAFLPLLVLPLIIYFILNQKGSPSSSKWKPLPPGPKPWPILGNILHVGKNPHISFAHFAKVHGPLISLRLGTRLLVIGSSPVAAAEILKTQDRLLSTRSVPKASPYKKDVFDRIAMICAWECTDTWRSLRALRRNELFSPKTIESQAIMRQRKAAEMVEFLGSREGRVVNIGAVLFTTVFNMLANLFLSKDLLQLQDEGVTGGPKGLIRRMREVAPSPNIVDFYPILEALDPQGLRRKLYDCIKDVYAVWEIDIKERERIRVHEAAEHDILDIFLAQGFNDLQINWLLLELFSAGADAASTTAEWAMAELVKNKEAVEKLVQELKKEINTSSLTESQVSQLPYLNTCVKETLRLHPPAPFLLPHRAIGTLEVTNCTFPRDAQMVVNVFAIGRDPSVWEDPLLIKPDRFLISNLDFRGQDYELLPFGSGRRICRGLPTASRQVPLILASLVHWYDWSLPHGEDPANLDMSDKFGITLQKEMPLLLVPGRNKQIQLLGQVPT